MAEINTVIAEASQDLQTIEDFVNLPADSEVYPRLLPSVNVGTLAGARQAIFEAGGLPAKPFATKALMTASALVDGDYAQVTDDTVNNGLYLKTAGAWVKSAYSPINKDYTDNNPLFKPKILTGSDNLNAIYESGIYQKASSGDILLSNGYPVALAGTLVVSSIIPAITQQTYTVYNTLEVYLRRALTASTWSAWQKQPTGTDITSLLTPINTSITSIQDRFTKGLSQVLEWQGIGNAEVTYDPLTKTTAIIGFILAPYPTSGGRIRINDISVTMTGAYDCCFLDLAALGTVNDVTTANQATVLKIGKYGDAGIYPRPDLIPLFKYDTSLKKVLPCAGFVPIKLIGGDAPASTSKTGFYFKKTATELTLYSDMPSGNVQQTKLIRQVVSAADTSNAQSQSDLWRVNSVIKTDKTLTSSANVVLNGEWSLAMVHKETTKDVGVTGDHVGGVHGDELSTYVAFYVDGVAKNQDFTTAAITDATEIQLVQKSVIYYQNTTRPLCDHYQVITFSKGMVNIKQRIDFKYEATELTTAWIAMLPTARDRDGVLVSNKSARSEDYFTSVDDNSVAGFVERHTAFNDGFAVRQWSTQEPTFIEVTVNKAPNFSELQSVYISNSPLYNKVYFSAKGTETNINTVVPLNTVWDVDTDFKVMC